jgi:hypothetical protein
MRKSIIVGIFSFFAALQVMAGALPKEPYELRYPQELWKQVQNDKVTFTSQEPTAVLVGSQGVPLVENQCAWQTRTITGSRTLKGPELKLPDFSVVRNPSKCGKDGERFYEDPLVSQNGTETPYVREVTYVEAEASKTTKWKIAYLFIGSSIYRNEGKCTEVVTSLGSAVVEPSDASGIVFPHVVTTAHEVKCPAPR